MTRLQKLMYLTEAANMRDVYKESTWKIGLKAFIDLGWTDESIVAAFMSKYPRYCDDGDVTKMSGINFAKQMLKYSDRIAELLRKDEGIDIIKEKKQSRKDEIIESQGRQLSILSKGIDSIRSYLHSPKFGVDVMVNKNDILLRLDEIRSEIMKAQDEL